MSHPRIIFETNVTGAKDLQGESFCSKHQGPLYLSAGSEPVHDLCSVMVM